MYVTFFVKYWQIIQKVTLIFILTFLPHINVSPVLWAHAPNCDANDVRVRCAFEKQAGFIQSRARRTNICSTSAREKNCFNWMHFDLCSVMKSGVEL